MKNTFVLISIIIAAFCATYYNRDSLGIAFVGDIHDIGSKFAGSNYDGMSVIIFSRNIHIYDRWDYHIKNDGLNKEKILEIHITTWIYKNYLHKLIVEYLDKVNTIREMRYKKIDNGLSASYFIYGMTVEHRKIIANDIYRILQGDSITIDNEHFKFTPLERWIIDATMTKRSIYIYHSYFDMILIDKNRMRKVWYSKDPYYRKDGVIKVLQDSIRDCYQNNYHSIFENEDYHVFMKFGNSEWQSNIESSNKEQIIKSFREELTGVLASGDK